MESTCQIFPLPHFRLQCGLTLPHAELAYATYGELNHDRSNTILYPTSYAAHHSDLDWLIGPERILDPTRYFIVIANMFGNGLSSSPSNLAEPYGPSSLALFSHVDNVGAQRRMLAERFGVERIALAYGWSMGAQQALQWGALFPDQVERILAICGTAKTTLHNRVFLEGLKAALTADPAWRGDHFAGRPEAGLRAFARVYAGWALSQEFYRREEYLPVGYGSLEDFLLRDWEASFLRRDAANLLSMIHTWSNNDISNNNRWQGDIKAALGGIRAKTFIMPCTHDLYFTLEDCQAEAEQIPGAELRALQSCWGHRAGNPSKSPADEALLRAAVADLLSQ